MNEKKKSELLERVKQVLLNISDEKILDALL